MNHLPETDAEVWAWRAMSECMLDAQMANIDLSRVNSPTRDVRAFEHAVFAAAGELIANSPQEMRPDLAWAVWACLTTDLKPTGGNLA